MDALQGLVPDSWLMYISIAVSVCAALAAVLPAPAQNGNIVYRILYTLIQWIGLNLGKAKNAQDMKSLGIKINNG